MRRPVRVALGRVSSACIAATVAAAALLALQAPSLAAGTTDWPMLGKDHHHTGYSADAEPNAGSAPKLGINWMANLYAADLGSPVIAFNTKLNANVIYAGDENGDVFAFNEATGKRIWGVNLGLGDPERATPMVAPDGSVWIAYAYGARVYKLDGATGATLCNKDLIASIDASPVLATPPGGVPTVFIGTNDGNIKSGEAVGLRESDCAQTFAFQNYQSNHAGVWASAALGLNATGKLVDVFGTSDPDSAEYGVDAASGTREWFYITEFGNLGYDIGEAAEISDAGTNGFANGVAYVSSKYGVMHALDLATGKNIWSFSMYPSGYNGPRNALSTPARDGIALVFGYEGGVYCVNAMTGAQIWSWAAPNQLEVISSPAIVGPAGKEVVAFADAGGMIHVLSLSDGSELYHYQTHGYMTASVAASNGHLVVTSSDGFLYDFAVNGGNSTAPSTVFNPPAGSDTGIPNPNGNLTIGGTATDAVGLSGLQVAIAYQGPQGPTWWDAATNTWDLAAVSNPATLTAPSGVKSNWTFAFPVAPGGGAYSVYSNAINMGHQTDPVGSQGTINVLPSTTAPQLSVSSKYISPGTSFDASATKFGPNEKVSFVVEGVTLATATTSSSGAVGPVDLKLPPSGIYGPTSKFGPATLSAFGETSHKTTTAFIDITNSWSQGGGAPSRNFYEPHDQKLHDLLHVARDAFISQAWYTQTNAAINSSPVISDGVAYVGNDLGTLTAINVITGTPKWSYKTPAGAGIKSPPAIDNGLAIFPAQDGAVYEVSTSTGALVASTPVGSIATSPAAAGGTFYVATKAGSVLAYMEPTGGVNNPVQIWSTSAGSTISGSVAYDSAASTKPVVVGTDAGTVVAFNSANGAKLWSVTLGGKITASPSILGGTVYIGSSNGNMYALSESTGAKLWTYPAGSAVNATAVTGGVVTLNPPNVVFGTASGSLIALDTAGVKQWEHPLGSPVVGLAAAFDIVITETADGSLWGNRGTQGGLHVWQFKTKAPLTTAPAIVNGAVYVGAGDTGLYAFTPYGQHPTAILRQTTSMPGLHRPADGRPPR